MKLFKKYLVNLSLEAYWCICQTKRHDLVFKVTVSCLEHGLLHVPFADSHSMVGTGELKLGESFISS